MGMPMQEARARTHAHAQEAAHTHANASCGVDAHATPSKLTRAFLAVNRIDRIVQH